MTTPRQFYIEQAAICAGQAAESDLPMLREKYDRAGAAWEALAEREANVARARAQRLADLAERERLAQEASHGSQ